MAHKRLYVKESSHSISAHLKNKVLVIKKSLNFCRSIKLVKIISERTIRNSIVSTRKIYTLMENLIQRRPRLSMSSLSNLTRKLSRN